MRQLASKDLGGKIAPLLAAKRTLCSNPGARHRANGCRDVFTAFLTADCEIALPSWRKTEHERQYRRIKDESSMWIPSDQSSERRLELDKCNPCN